MYSDETNRNNLRQQDILVVDDNPTSLQLLMDILNKAGYHARLASNGPIALRSVEYKPPDLILLDVKMPGMDGYEVCRRLKSNVKNSNIPVIFISGLSETTQKVQGFNAGGVDYIAKPFEPEEIVARVTLHIRLRELTERLEQKVEERTRELTTANKQLQEEIAVRKETERNLILLNFAMNNVHEAIYLIDQDARFKLVNEESCRILQYSHSELLNMGVYDIDLDMTIDSWPAHWNELKDKHTMTFEGRHKAKNGRIFTVEINANYVQYDNHTYNMALVRDITERKLAEQSMHRLNRELRAISKCNQIMMRSVDERVLLHNICQIICEDAGYRMAWVGYAENDADRTVRPVSWAGAETDYLKNIKISWGNTEWGHGPSGIAIRSGQSVCTHDFQTDPKIAPWRYDALQRGYRSSVALPLKDESDGTTFGVLNIYASEPKTFTPDEIRLMEELAGDLAFGIVTLRNRAERKQAEAQKEEAIEAMRQAKEQAEAANKYKTEFLTNISHELRTPLHAILGFANILQSVEMEEEYQRSVEFINERGKHLLTLVENILDVSNMELGTTQFKSEEFDLLNLIKNAMATAKTGLVEKNVALVLSVEGTIPQLKGDVARVQQILDNLLNNAVKYTEHGEILLTVTSDDTQPDQEKCGIKISVKDTGIGIPAEKLPYIFDPFSRFHEFYKGKSIKGTGMGLTIVKVLVRLMGGDIQATSEPGKGSEFRVTLNFDKVKS
jgi:PAS domain S-box-containing protein